MLCVLWELVCVCVVGEWVCHHILCTCKAIGIATSSPMAVHIHVLASSPHLNLNLLLLFAVKFLREVTPYFRKASIISEVGWELQRAFLCPLGPGAPTSPPAPTPKTTPRADTRYIPLQLTHLARNLKYIDPGKWPACL